MLSLMSEPTAHFSGKREERGYVNGVLTGPAVIYGPKGDKFEFAYKEGLVSGPAIYFKETGATEERTYTDGVCHGAATLREEKEKIQFRVFLPELSCRFCSGPRCLL